MTRTRIIYIIRREAAILRKSLPLLLCLALAAASCRGDDEEVVQPTVSTVSNAGEGTSFYLLCEGNMGSNKASLDFFDATTGQYHKNIFPAANPGIAFELGDVGNDLAVRGERLYAVINCSNLIEVADRRTARHIGQVSVANCRHIAFHEGYAYVSSYAGPVSLSPTSRRGCVVRIDTATLAVTDTCVVGYQPEQMAVVGNRLYVANSGGYRAPDYDRTVSVIDLETFREVKQIDVAPNLQQLLAADGRLYVQSRGNYTNMLPEVFELDPATEKAVPLDIAARRICIDDGRLYALTTNAAGSTAALRLTIFNLKTHATEKTVSLDALTLPHGIAVDPLTKNIYVTDAKDYVSPGTLHCLSPDGTPRWKATTGDIPSCFAFTSATAAGSGNEATSANTISRVFEYRPAPGQFVNVYPPYVPGDTEADMVRKAEEAVKGTRRGVVTLGSFGGYIVCGFERSVENREGVRDFRILGNAFEGNSEPGIVCVMRDDNGNGLPDDTWYTIAGSEHSGVAYCYSVFYNRPDADHVPDAGPESWCADARHIYWQEVGGSSGYLQQNTWHLQPYFPQWIESNSIVFKGLRLPANAEKSGDSWLLKTYGWGYADNAPNNSEGSLIDIDWAVDAAGQRVHLDRIDFVKVYTGVLQQCGPLGETSTEFCGAEAL